MFRGWQDTLKGRRWIMYWIHNKSGRRCKKLKNVCSRHNETTSVWQAFSRDQMLARLGAPCLNMIPDGWRVMGIIIALKLIINKYLIIKISWYRLPPTIRRSSIWKWSSIKKYKKTKVSIWIIKSWIEERATKTWLSRTFRTAQKSIVILITTTTKVINKIRKVFSG